MTIPTGGPTEPASDIRQAASVWRQIYIALTNEGFTPAEALHLVGTVIAASLNGNTGSNDT